jgi:hypothetical protein
MFSALFVLEHYFPGNALIKSRKETTRLRIAQQMRRGGKGKIIPVERVRSTSPEEFRRRYLSKGIPVILEKAAADWPCVKQWSFSGLKERFGHENIKLLQHKGLSDDDFVDEREFSEEIQFGAFLDQVITGGRKYMRFSPLLEKFPELRKDFDRTFFKTMSGSWWTQYQMFIGGRGTYTPLHNAMSPFFFVNVCGIKRWALIPCQYLAVLNPRTEQLNYNHTDAAIDLSNVDEFPGFESIDRMEAVIGPSDVLYIPAWLWHCVQNDAPTIGVRCGFIHPRNMVSESFTLTFLRLFASRDRSLLRSLYYQLFKTNLPDRDDWLLTAKLYRNESDR